MKKLLLLIFIGLLWAANTKAQTVWQVSTLAGNGTSGNVGDAGPALNALLSSPGGIHLNTKGDIYFWDEGNSSFRKITTAGTISTVTRDKASSNTINCGSFSYPFYTYSTVFSDSLGAIYELNQGSGNGFGLWRYALGVWTELDVKVSAICVDRKGTLYDFKSNGQLWKYSSSGTRTLLASSGYNYVSTACTDSAGNIYCVDVCSALIKKITPTGTSLATYTYSNKYVPQSICADAMGNIYFTSHNSSIHSDNHFISMMSVGGTVTQIAGGTNPGYVDGVSTSASFNTPQSITIDKTGNLYVTDHDNNVIRKIQPKLSAPPVPNYSLPASMCVGSTANYQSATTGSQVGLTILIDSSITMPAPKAICRNKNGVFIVSAADSVLFYDFNGNKQFAYNTMPLFQNVTAIAADASNRLYMVAPDQSNPSIPSIYRLDAQGNWDTQFSITSGVLNSASALAFGPGYLYAVDTLGPYIDKIDTTSSGSPATVTQLPQPSNNQYSFFLPTSLVFGSNGQIYLADAGHKAILARNPSDNNYYAIDSLLGTHHSFSFDMDTTITNNVYNNTFYITSDISPSLTLINNYSVPAKDSMVFVHQADTLPLMHLRNPMGSVYVNHGGTIPLSWIANTGGNNVMRVSVFAYSISPPLPAGLNYNFVSGKITGSPTTAASFTTYTIVTTSTAGSNTTTVAFSVVPPGPISNTVGTTSSAVVNQTDGLTVNYFNTSDCSQMISIQDAPGGTVLGNTIATQTVYPTIATFNADTFVGRVTTVSTQEPDSALANVQLNFTYQDIQHYNASVAATYTLSNDTTITKTMQVGILQMHTKNTGSMQPISHSPLTAHWIAAHHDWEMTFAVTKFSTFYMGDPTKIGAFTCQTTSKDSIIALDYYMWNKDSLFNSGVYMDTLVNQSGCDSILTLKLTINVTTGVQVAQSLNAAVRVYPNPSNGLVNIENQNVNSEIQNIRVFNLVGEQLYSVSSPNQKYLLDISNLTKGVYFIQIETKNETATRRILVE